MKPTGNIQQNVNPSYYKLLLYFPTVWTIMIEENNKLVFDDISQPNTMF